MTCRSTAAFAGILLLLLSAPAGALEIAPTDDAELLSSTLLGPGITLSDPTYTGASVAAATFTGGIAAGIGIDRGILLATGSAAHADGPNLNGAFPEVLGYGDTSGGVGESLGLPGDPDLNGLIPGLETVDAAALEFDFSSAGGSLYFNYVFGSEEYVGYVNTDYNDVFGFFLDGRNIAMVPGTDSPVAINSVNPLLNPEFYVGNLPYAADYEFPDDLVPSDGVFDVEYDGFTRVFTATVLDLAPGTHHIKLAIADATDGILNSGVFLQAGTFADRPTEPVPEPSTLLLLGSGLVPLLRRRRKG